MCADGHRNMRDPHVLLVHTVSHPQITIGRSSVTFLNTPYILRPEWFIITSVTHRCNFAMHQIQGRIFQPVLTERDSQRPTELGRIIHRGVCTVTQTLPPNLRITVNKAFRTFHRLRPRIPTILADGSQGMFPQAYQTTVGQSIVTIRFVFFV